MLNSLGGAPTAAAAAPSMESPNEPSALVAARSAILPLSVAFETARRGFLARVNDTRHPDSTPEKPVANHDGEIYFKIIRARKLANVQKLGKQDPWLGAVGVLQFEVLKERLQSEYNTRADLEPLSYSCARWIGGAPEALEWLKLRNQFKVLTDRNDNPVLLAETAWAADYALRNAPGIELYDVEPL